MSAQHKKISFLYNMVTASIFSFRNVARDTKMFSLANKIKDTVDYEDGGFTVLYSQRLSYTDDLTFNWSLHKDVPQEFKSLQTWWDMVQSGADDVECYNFYINNVANPVSNSWQEAINDAHKIWKPEDERLINPEGTNDPN